MKIYIKLVKYFLNFSSIFSTNYAGKIATKAFQKVRITKIKKREQNFYQKAIYNTLPFQQKTIHYYEFGVKNKPIIFLVHGWESNAGSLSQFAFKFTELGYRVISIDFPGHGKAPGTHTNMFECKNMLKALIEHINPIEEFSVIGHSFGSGASSYALSEGKYKVNKLVLLTSINKISDVFYGFKKIVGFNDKVYQSVLKHIEKIGGEKIENMVISDKLNTANYHEMMIIHDEFDKVISIKKAKEIEQLTQRSSLKIFQKIGHYRMLWNDDVLKETVNFITK
jgi:pimeloyl-ACP methyl ester carboxylesterase